MPTMVKQLLFALVLLVGTTQLYAQDDLIANQETNETTGLCLLCNIADAPLAVDGDLNTASTLSSTLGLLGGTNSQTLIFPGIAAAGMITEVKLGSQDLLADVAAFGGIDLELFLGNTPTGDIVTVSSVAAVLTGSTFLANITGTAPYDRVRIKMRSGLAGLLSVLEVYQARVIGGISGFVPECTMPDVATSSATGLIPGTVTNEAAITTPDPTDFTELSIALGLLASSATVEGTYSTIVSCPDDSLNVLLEFPGGISVGLFGNVTVDVLFNGAVVSSEVLAPTNIDVLSGTNFANYHVKPGNVFNGFRVTLNGGLLTLLSTINVYGACMFRKAAPAPDPVNGQIFDICYNESISANVTLRNPSDIVEVYDDPAKTSLVYSGFPPVIAGPFLATDTLYVFATSAVGACTSTSYDSIIVNVAPEVLPAVLSPTRYCYGERAAIVPGPAGNSFIFYADAAGTTELGRGGVYLTDTLYTDTVFYVQNTFNGTCVSDVLVPAPVLLRSALVNSYIAQDTIGTCGGSDIPIYITGQMPSAAAITYKVYDRDTNLLMDVNGFPATFVAGDTTFIPGAYANLPSLGDVDTLYIDATDGNCDETADKKMIILQSVTAPSTPVTSVSPVYVCDGGTAVLTANSPSVPVYAQYYWYDAPTGGSLVTIGDTIFFNGVTDTTRLYVEVNLGACSSSSRSLVEIINLSEQANNLDSLSTTICSGNTTTLSPTLLPGTLAGVDYTWYDAPVGGTVVFVGKDFTTSETATVTYYLEISNVSCVDQPRFPATITVLTTEPVISAVSDLSIYLCTGDDAVVAATGTSPSGGDASLLEVTWWTSPIGGTQLFTGDEYTFTPVTDTTLIYAQSAVEECPSAVRLGFQVINATAFAVPTTVGDSICSGERADVSATSSIPSLGISWYGAPSGGAVLTTGPNYTTPNLFSTTNFYAQIDFKDGYCASAGRTAAEVAIKPQLQSPTVNPNCSSSQNDVVILWNATSGAQGYTVRYSVNSGSSTILTFPAGTTSYAFTGLNPGDVVVYQVRATGSLVCEASEYSEAYSCIASACGLGNLRLDMPFYEMCYGDAVTITLDGLTADTEVDINNSGTFIPTGGMPVTYTYNSIAEITPPPFGGAAIDTVYFTVQVRNATGCDNIVVKAVVKVNPVPVIDIDAFAVTPAVVGQFINTYQFISNTAGAVTWNWNFGDGTTSTESSPQHEYANEGAYKVSLSVSNSFGCTAMADLAKLIPVSSVPEVFIPNTFTPNGDGKNDGFRVFGEGISLENLSVYNQYGNLVYESSVLKDVWDGTYNGKEVPQGSYYYTAIIIDYLGEKYSREGTVTLIRRK